MRHSLFVCGLSLVIAAGVAVAGVFVHQEDAPSFTHAGASTRAQVSKGESTSLGVLTKFVKESSPSETTEPPPGASGETPAAAPAEEPSPSAAAESTPEGTAEAGPVETSEPRVFSAPANEAPALTEVPAQAADVVVSASRFRGALTPASAAASSGATISRSQAVSAAVSPPQPGDRLTVPLTFYYCEDTTSGERRGDGGGFCGTMRNGAVVYPGAAACDSSLLGQRFKIEGDPTDRVYVCADTGGGIRGQHRDIWFLSSAEGWAWQQSVGTFAVIQILP